MTVRRLLLAAAFLRSVATAMSGVLLGFYLAALALSPAQTGAVIGTGLLGVAVAALVATTAGDRLGRRRVLTGVSLLGACGALAIAAGSSPAVLTLAAFLGMANGMGRDRGAALILDQAILPETTTDRERTFVFAWYNVVQDAGHAVGGLLAGAPLVARSLLGTSQVGSIRIALLAPAVLLVAVAFCYARLPRGDERASSREAPPLSPASRSVLLRISALFALDSFAGGFLTSALLSYFFLERFGASEAAVGGLFFGARVLNALSHWAAAWLAVRIGLVNTTVFTHVPSSLLLVTVAFAPSFPVAAVLFLLREGLVEMDVPTRQSYVLAVVRPEERTLASGVTNLVRLGGWAAAPFAAGTLMQAGSLAAPLLVGAALKLAYDALLYVGFRALRPPEEAPARRPPPQRSSCID
ncbi:MAG: MFS transporter [Thermodesulfobacteriota bacterium]